MGFRNVRVAPSPAFQCGTGPSRDKETGRQIETTVLNLAGFFCIALQKPAGNDLGSFSMIVPTKILIFCTKNPVDFLYDFLTIHKICYYEVRVSTGGVETRWLGWQFLHFL